MRAEGIKGGLTWDVRTVLFPGNAEKKTLQNQVMDRVQQMTENAQQMVDNANLLFDCSLAMMILMVVLCIPLFIIMCWQYGGNMRNLCLRIRKCCSSRNEEDNLTEVAPTLDEDSHSTGGSVSQPVRHSRSEPGTSRGFLQKRWETRMDLQGGQRETSL